MLIRTSPRRVAICFDSVRQADHRARRLYAKATEAGTIVAVYFASAPDKFREKVEGDGSLIDLMVAANRHEFEAVVADFETMFSGPWEIDCVVNRLTALGIEAFDINNFGTGRLESILRVLMSETRSSDHGRRVRAGIAAAKARRSAGGRNGVQASGGGH